MDDLFDDIQQEINKIDGHEESDVPINHIAFVLDKSGSMTDIRDSARKNFNDQLKEIRRESHDQETKITLVEFSDRVKFNYTDMPIEAVKEMDDYKIGGMTALYDAVGLTIERFREIPELFDRDKNHSALLIIITDGAENSSTKYNSNGLKELVKSLEDRGNWTFTFMGTSDIFSQGVVEMGFNVGNTVSFEKDRYGMAKSSMDIRSGLNNYYSTRRSGGKSVTNFYNDNSTYNPLSEGLDAVSYNYELRGPSYFSSGIKPEDLEKAMNKLSQQMIIDEKKKYEGYISSIPGFSIIESGDQENDD